MHRKPTIERYVFPILLVVLVLGPAIRMAWGQVTAEPLPPGSSLEREVTGAVTHRYTVDLKRDEFFQVTVLQKGVDVRLTLTDADGKLLATMDSPIGAGGAEVLTWVADAPCRLTLEVTGNNAKTEKAAYAIRREPARPATVRDRRRVEVERLYFEAAKLSMDPSAGEKTLKAFLDALAGWRELGDTEREKITERCVAFFTMNGRVRYAHRLLDDAFQLRTEGQKQGSLEMFAKAKGKALEAAAAFREAGSLAVQFLANYTEYVAANPVLRRYTNFARSGEMNAASFMASHFQYLAEPRERVRYAKLAMTLAKQMREEPAGDDEGSMALSETAALYSYAGALAEIKDPETIKYYDLLIAKYHEVQRLDPKSYNARTEAQMLVTMHDLYEDRAICKSDQAVCEKRSIESSEKAAALFDSVNDKNGVANAFLSISQSYRVLNELYKSMEYSDKAIAVASLPEAAGKVDMATMLGSRTVLLMLLGNKERSNENARQVLDLELAIKPYNDAEVGPTLTPMERRHRLISERARLGTIGSIYLRFEDSQKALETYQAVFVLDKLLGDKGFEADDRAAASLAYRGLKDWARAMEAAQAALALALEVHDKKNEIGILVDIGIIYLAEQKPADALKAINSARVIAGSLGVEDPGVMNNLARAWHAAGNQRLAIFYGTQMVNWILGERQRLGSFDAATQQGFVNAFEGPIRRLADWLIERGQFGRAEKVLRVLKEEEFSDFARRDTDEIRTLGDRLKFEGKEKEVLERYNRLAESVSTIGKKYNDLDDKKLQLAQNNLPLSAEDQRLYEEYEKQLKTANDAFQLFLEKQLSKELGDKRTSEVEVQSSRQEELRMLGKGAVMLYTVVGEDRYRVMLTTRNTRIDGKYEIKAEELNKKVYAFRDALRNPRVDPRPLGKELYDILIKPIEADLKKAGAKTLIWSLDGTLRYIPLAALSPDGIHYLVEDYQNVIITPKTGLNVTQPRSDWRALGLGVSTNETVPNPDDPSGKIPFPPIPGARVELLSIVRDENVNGESGVLPGKRFLDNAFTLPALRESLDTRDAQGKRVFSVMHIASHFRLGTSIYNSFLLMGNNQILTLNDLKGSSIKFGELDLVTLSACNTASVDVSNGKEIDSLAEVIQNQGGRSVLATLWSVADESTQMIMTEFYRLKKTNPQMTKAEAMRTAQIAMIEGTLQTASNDEKDGAFAGPTKGVEIVPSNGAARTAPLFAFDKAKPYSHPYFWSPFILIGNWQ